jgi:putative ABC transport system permease protein
VRADDNRPERLADAVMGEVRAGGREFPLWVRTMSAHWGVALMQERLLAGTSVAFGMLGLVIAAIGLFGLLSYYVTSRRTEIGIRMALGAGRGEISRLFIREVAGLVAAGCASGGVLLFLTSRLFAGLFSGVEPAGAWLISLNFALIGLVALLSVWVTLRRAMSIDPLVALRGD